jgi:penicillin-binding protein 1A
MTWHTVMAYAHQGVELRNLPGLPPNSVSVGPQVAEAREDVPRPAMLSSRSVKVLSRIEQLLDEAARDPAPAAPRAQQQSNAESPAAHTAAAAQGRDARVRN